MIKGWLGCLGLVLCLPWSGARAQAPKVQAAPELACFQDESLATLVREQMGKAALKHWQLTLKAKPGAGLELLLRYRGKRTGRRSFDALPEDCPSQQRLVSTVAVLAMENWRSRNNPQASPAPGPSHKQERPRNPEKRRSQGSSKRKAKAPDKSDKKNNDQPQRPQREQNSALDQEPDPVPKPGPREQEGRADPSLQRNSSRNRATQDAQRRRRDEQDERDSARLARDIARQQAQDRQRAQKRAPGPFALEGGVGLGAAYGASANVGPQLDGWLSAARKRFAIRAGARLTYGLPRTLGPARLHSGLAGFTLDLCLRPGRYTPSGALEFWGCLGGMGGVVIARGQGSDDDQEGLRPVAGPTLTFELPIAQRRSHHWAIGVLGGLNLVRTRFDLLSSAAGTPLLHSYTMPAFHLSLQLRWRKSGAPRQGG